ncbi:MAG: ABC transporter ATPase [Luteitalea sp.]|nr:ABC transporter ATPase [Luteitalea sp.]
MSNVPFESLPEDARAWVFATDRPLDGSERDRVLAEVDAFLDDWTAHGVPLQAARDFRHDRFLLVAVDERAAGASGCSIDALVRRIKQVGDALGTTLLDHAPVYYRGGGGIVCVSRDEFADRATRGEVTPDTLVFNNAVTSVGEIRQGRWETPASESWHGQVFF